MRKMIVLACTLTLAFAAVSFADQHHGGGGGGGHAGGGGPVVVVPGGGPGGHAGGGGGGAQPHPGDHDGWHGGGGGGGGPVVVVPGGGPGGHANPGGGSWHGPGGWGHGDYDHDHDWHNGYWRDDGVWIVYPVGPGWGYYDGWGYCHYWGGVYENCYPYYTPAPAYDDVYVACAPEVVDSNVATTDKALAELSTGELNNAPTFKAKAAAIAAMPAGRDKTNAYFNLIGVDPNNSSEILNVIYARQIDQKYVTAVSQNLELTADQATLVIDRVTTALKPRQ